MAADDAFSGGRTSGQDPGWAMSGADMLGLIFPPLLLRRRGEAGGGQIRRGGRPPISLLRSIFIVFAEALVLFLVVLAFILPLQDTAQAVDPVVYAVLAMALAGPLGGMWTRRRRLQCGDRDDLAQQYASLFFVGVALSESAALFGFVASFLAGGYWPYLVGLALAAVGFWLIAPTRADVRRRQEHLTTSGCATSLSQALYTTAAADPGTGSSNGSSRPG